MGSKRYKEPRRRQSSSRDLVPAAVALAKLEHKNDRLKFVIGPYFQHVNAVARSMHSQDEKVIAFLHDVVEHHVKSLLGDNPDPVAEEEAIKAKLGKIEKYFKNCHQDISHLIPFLDDLTKRRSESYETYMRRLMNSAKERAAKMPEAQAFIAIKVKKADLRNNRDDKRNKAISARTPKDVERLLRYDLYIRILDNQFPSVILRFDPREEEAHRQEMERRKLGLRLKTNQTVGWVKGRKRPLGNRRKRDGYEL